MLICHRSLGFECIHFTPRAASGVIPCLDCPLQRSEDPALAPMFFVALVNPPPPVRPQPASPALSSLPVPIFVKAILDPACWHALLRLLLSVLVAVAVKDTVLAQGTSLWQLGA